MTYHGEWGRGVAHNICFTIFATPTAFKQLKRHFQYRRSYDFEKLLGMFKSNLSLMKIIQMDSLRMNNSSICKVGSHSCNDQHFCFLWTLLFDSLNVCSVFTAPQRPSDELRTHLHQVNV